MIQHGEKIVAPHPARQRLAALLESNLAVWAVLMLAAVPSVAPVLGGWEPWRHAIRPTGLIAVQLMVVALSIAPLRALFPRSALLMWAQRRRRAVGLAAFSHVSLHMVFFVLAIGRLDYILQGLAFASMWTGWLAFVVLTPVAAISNDGAMRMLGRAWKRIQRLAHVSAVLALAHWLLLTRSAVETLAWFAPLVLIQALRLWKTYRGAGRKAGTAG